MPAISNKEVIVFSSNEGQVLGIYDSFTSLYARGIKPCHQKYLPGSQEELIVNLLNNGQYCFGTYKLELRKAAEGLK